MLLCDRTPTRCGGKAGVMSERLTDAEARPLVAVFLPILFSYSFQLAMIVLLFAGLIACVVMAMVPTFQRRLNALYAAEGQRQGMLVEVIHGMRTVKALAIEPNQRRIWDQRSAEAITMHFRVGQISPHDLRADRVVSVPRPASSNMLSVLHQCRKSAWSSYP